MECNKYLLVTCVRFYIRYLHHTRCNNLSRDTPEKECERRMFNLSYFLQNHHEPISDLFVDLRDGNRLLSLLEVLTSKTYVSMSQTYLGYNNRLAVIHNFAQVFPCHT